TRLHAQYHGVQPRITEAEQQEFLKLCLHRAGADAMITPREIIRDYVSLLNILLQNPEADASSLINGGAVKLEHEKTDPDEITEPAQSYDKTKYDFNIEDIEI
ncbi:MAG: DUF2791 family P-loop domain-containing protein, partial [Clostridia bacterium]|nr:DUF2791 family P-loop domain-containing protein [Clostridia bacterium]